MSSLWPQLEPLLAKVQKPARYIGCEDGAQARPRPGPGRPGCWPTPTPTRSACPTRACRSCTRSSTSAPMRWPSAPTPPGPTSRSCCGASACRCSRSTRTAPAGDFDVLAFNLSAELVYTNVLNCIDLAGVPGAGRATAAPSTRWSAPAATAPTTPSRWPTSSTSSCWATARRSWARSPRWSRDWKASGRTDGLARARPARAGPDPGRLRAVDVRRRPTTAPTCVAVTPRYADVPERVEKRTIADLADWPYPKQPAGAAHRGGARPAQRRGLPGLHPGLPLLPGRHDHPAGPRAPGRAGAHDGAPTACERTGYDEVALTSLSTADFSGIETVVARHGQRPRQRRPGVGVAAEPAGRRVHRRASPPSSRRPAAPASRSPPRPAPGACARSSTS